MPQNCTKMFRILQSTVSDSSKENEIIKLTSSIAVFIWGKYVFILLALQMTAFSYPRVWTNSVFEVD